MEGIKDFLSQLRGTGTTFKPLSPREYAQFRVNSINDDIGRCNEEDGYECSLCKNKGYIANMVELEDGTFSHSISDCKCVPVRSSIMRMRRSGLRDIIRDYTFDKFEATEPWQEALKKAAMTYATNPEGWFFVGGQVGCGKTHICTAISREFLLAGKNVRYMLWRDEIVAIKANVGDSETYKRMVDVYKTVDVLYIDDLFKTGKSPSGDYQKPTIADINVAFEILNFRYSNPESITIISTELTEDELLDIDEAVGSRIYERAKGSAITVGKDRSRNYRLKGTTTL